ncbi:unnamed protein product [Boreogadus saida]
MCIINPLPGEDETRATRARKAGRTAGAQEAQPEAVAPRQAARGRAARRTLQREAGEGAAQPLGPAAAPHAGALRRGAAAGERDAGERENQTRRPQAARPGAAATQRRQPRHLPGATRPTPRARPRDGTATQRRGAPQHAKKEEAEKNRDGRNKENKRKGNAVHPLELTPHLATHNTTN